MSETIETLRAQKTAILPRFENLRAALRWREPTLEEAARWAADVAAGQRVNAALQRAANDPPVRTRADIRDSLARLLRKEREASLPHQHGTASPSHPRPHRRHARILVVRYTTDPHGLHFYLPPAMVLVARRPKRATATSVAPHAATGHLVDSASFE